MGNTASAERQVDAIDCDVLWVGKPAPAMSVLPQRGARVEQVPLEEGVGGVTALAPDLVVLNAENDQVAAQFAEALQQQQAGKTTPVIVLCDGDAVAPLRAAERSGIVARLDPRASGDEVAVALETQLRTQSGALLEPGLSFAATELGDWVAEAKRKGVCGLVLATETPHVLVLGPGEATVPTQQHFGAALGAGSAQSLCLVQLPASRVRVLTEPAPTPLEGETLSLSQIRVAVVHSDRARQTLWQRHMASAGAEVLFEEVEDNALSNLGDSAPDLLVVHEHALGRLMKARCWWDVRLQFSSLLVVSATCANELHPYDLVAEAADLLSTHARLQARIAAGDLLVERVESLGPARWLREIQGYDGLVELRVNTPQGSASVRVDHGEVQEARFWPRMSHGQELQGSAALKALLDARFGRLIVGQPQQVADADHRLRRVEECAEGALAATRETTVQSSPVAESSAHPSVAPVIELAAHRAERYGAKLRPQAMAVGTLALLALVGSAMGFTAPIARHPSAMANAPARAAEHSARSALFRASAVAPAAVASIREDAERVADVALRVAPPEAEAALSVADVITDRAPSVAERADAPEARAQLQGPAPSALGTTGAGVASLHGEEGSAGGVELPLRLRRWLKPTSVQQRVIEAFLARADKNFAKAERLLTEAHELDPSDPEVAYQLALTYARQGRLDQTLSWARQARQLGPLDPAPVALEGDIHFLRGQLLESEQAWRQCLQLRPGYPGCIRRLEQLKPHP